MQYRETIYRPRSYKHECLSDGLFSENTKHIISVNGIPLVLIYTNVKKTSTSPALVLITPRLYGHPVKACLIPVFILSICAPLFPLYNVLQVLHFSQRSTNKIKQYNLMIPFTKIGLVFFL